MSLLMKLARPVLQRNLYVASALRFPTGDVNKLADDETSFKPKTNAAEQKLLVSDSCMKRLREICKDGSFLRVTVEGGGCSGFQYKFDLDKELKDDDQVFGEGEAKVVIDNTSLEYCTGSTVDYHVELIRAGFRILANPLANRAALAVLRSQSNWIRNLLLN